MKSQNILLFSLLTFSVCAQFMKKEESSDDDNGWKSWKHRKGKHYNCSNQEKYRKQVWKQNCNKSKMLHQRDPNVTYIASNRFGDMPSDEFNKTHLTLKLNQTHRVLLGASRNLSRPDLGARRFRKKKTVVQKVIIPDIDWKMKGKVTPVKDQGNCGSCYAFATTGAVESLWLVNTKMPALNLSQQELVDCSSAYGNDGCDGGPLQGGNKYVKKQMGLWNQTIYPYKQKVGQCRIFRNTTRMKYMRQGKISNQKSSWDLSSSNCQRYLYKQIMYNPVQVAVDASNWQFYGGGIFTNCSDNLDHAVLAVGVTPNYTLIKNSWGTDWGEDGYIRLAPGNTCGVCQYNAWPIF